MLSATFAIELDTHDFIFSISANCSYCGLSIKYGQENKNNSRRLINLSNIRIPTYI